MAVHNFQDLTGKIFGRLTVLNRAEDKINSYGRRVQWKCQCSCGNIVTVLAINLKRGITQSCGCYNREKISERSFKDITNQRFGHLIAIKRDEDCFDSRGKRLTCWLCKCDCGNECIVKRGYLIQGKTKSCGCVTKKMQSEALKKYNTYNLTGEYGIGYTNKGEEFYFDLEDYDKIKDYCWYISSGYVISRKNIIMHRLIMNIKDSNYDVDHIYHNKVDNRKSQLRIVNRSQNSMNTKIKTSNKSGITGVCWDKSREKWIVNIKINYKLINLGRYSNKEDAIKARKEAEIKYFGEYRYKGDEINNEANIS